MKSNLMVASLGMSVLLSGCGGPTVFPKGPDLPYPRTPVSNPKADEKPILPVPPETPTKALPRGIPLKIDVPAKKPDEPKTGDAPKTSEPKTGDAPKLDAPKAVEATKPADTKSAPVTKDAEKKDAPAPVKDDKK